MAIDPWGTLAAGGKPALDLLEYGVISARFELVAGWLIAEYRSRPTAARALALYDAFLAPDAPARIDAPSVLPPRELLLAARIDGIRRHHVETEAHNTRDPESPRPAMIPPMNLFDAVLAALRADDFEPVRSVRESYDPARGPIENLPDGRLSPGQRQFLEYTWRKRLRPLLARSGFGRITTIGG